MKKIEKKKRKRAHRQGAKRKQRKNLNKNEACQVKT